MVNLRFCFLLFALCIATPVCTTLQARELSEYRVGDKVEVDIVAAERMTVIDREATEALQEREAQNVPVICRFYPGAVDEAEAALHKAFSDARLAYAASLKSKFKQRTLDEATIASTEFRKFADGLQRRNTSFPINLELAALWARGESDDGLEESLATRLRETMQRPTRPYGLPDGLKLTYTVRLVPLPDPDATATLELVEREGRNMARTNLITLPWAKTKLQERFDSAEQAWARFVAGFVRENCYPDPQLTRQARLKRTELLKVADTYEAGQIIARKEAVVDSKIFAAIQQQVGLIAERQKLQMDSQIQVTATDAHRWWIYAIGGGMLGLVVALVVSRRRQRSLLPARTGRQSVVTHPSELRGGMGPYLAHLLSGNIFQRLLSQRAQMIATQERAAADMDEMEAQLEKVRAPLQDRLRAYEKRIADLERELSAHVEENEALLKAKIGMVKKQLETTRQKNRIDLN